MALHSQLDELINAMLPFVQQFHAKRQLAPHAASVNEAGEIAGSALVTQDDRALSVSQAISYFESKFRQAAKVKEIVASAIFFHGVGMADPALPAQTEDEACAIVAFLEHRVGDSVILVIPYRNAGGSIEYDLGKLIKKPATVFAASEVAGKPWWRVW